MNSLSPPPPSLTARRDKAVSQIALGVYGLFLLLFLLALVRVGVGNIEPTVVYPSPPPMPRPNAYDTYVRAGKLLQRTSDLGGVFAAKPKRVWAVSDKMAIVAANADALKALRPGLTQEFYQVPHVRSMFTRYPEYAQFRNLARLLSLEGQIRLGNGDPSGGVSDLLDSVHLGQQIPRGGALILRLVGIASQAVGRKPLWAEVDQLDAGTARAAAHRMEQILAEKAPDVDTYREEKYEGQAALLESFRDPVKTSVDTDSSDSERAASKFAPAYMQWVYLRYSKRQIMANYIQYMDQFVQQSRGRYTAHPTALPLPSDPISQGIVTIFPRAIHKSLGNDTQNVLLAIALALRAYHEEHHAYPTSLQELCPRYLSHLPDDPFAASGPPRYRLTGDRYVLYSIGPDSKDDGGKAIEERNEQGEITHFSSYNSKGDIVAGVNLF